MWKIFERALRRVVIVVDYMSYLLDLLLSLVNYRSLSLLIEVILVIAESSLIVIVGLVGSASCMGHVRVTY